MVTRIDHVGILVDNLEEAKAFLKSIGLSTFQESEEPSWGRIWALFRCGNADIELVQEVDRKLSHGVLGENRAKVEHVAFEVNDLHQALISLGSHGIQADEHGIFRGTFNGRTRDAAWTKPSAVSGVVWQFLEYKGENTT